MIIGNGGSAGIAGHIAIDLLKNAGIPAMTFNDASSLTCLGNDLGYDAVFQKPVEVHARPDDVLIAISSSGRSKNILSAVLEAQEAGCFIVTLSGFDADNPLRSMGDLNVYVPSHSYGAVEITHLAICHCVVDALVTYG
jgi:D-sedoheptulose 7-phosphate isomerase